MDLFISYSSKYRDLCERLRLALEAEGHRAFVDRSELEPGETFNAELREAVAECDVFIFLVSPESIAGGSYALAELGLAQNRWRHPRGRVLPVVVAPTPIESIPPYLKAVTLLQPQGDVVAETLAAVARMSTRRRIWPLTVAGVVLVLIAATAIAYFWQQRAAENRRVALEIGSAAELCTGGAHAAAWQRFGELATRSAEREDLRLAREQCGMRWLREIRVQVGKQTFSEIVTLVQPILVEGLSTATGRRAADLRAHLGWADTLRARDGAADVDSDAHFQRALQDEPDNVYAHAMLGRQFLMRDREAEARTHFDRAVASGRDRAFVRSLQLSAALYRAATNSYAVIVSNDMRVAGDALTDGQRRALWNSGYRYLFYAEDRASFLSLLPPEVHLANFDWLFPPAWVREDERLIWRYCRALLLINADRKAEARTELEALMVEFKARKMDGRIVDQTRKSLASLSAPAGK
jgi:hypothetical protein